MKPLKLTDSVVNRRGVTAQDWGPGTQDIEAKVGVWKALEFTFVIPSKGGGETLVELTIGEDDLRRLLPELAMRREDLAETFVECSHCVVASLLARVRESQVARGAE